MSDGGERALCDPKGVDQEFDQLLCRSLSALLTCRSLELFRVSVFLGTDVSVGSSCGSRESPGRDPLSHPDLVEIGLGSGLEVGWHLIR